MDKGSGRTTPAPTILCGADLRHLYFKIEPKLALVAITLAMAHIRHLFKRVEFQASTRLVKLVTKEVSNKLDKQIPIIVNKYRTFNLKVPIDDTGRAFNLKEAINTATSLTMTPTNVLIKFNEGTDRYQANLNLIKAQAIRIYSDPREQEQEQNPNQACVTRGQTRLQQQLGQEEIYRDVEYRKGRLKKTTCIHQQRRMRSLILT